MSTVIIEPVFRERCWGRVKVPQWESQVRRLSTCGHPQDFFPGAGVRSLKGSLGTGMGYKHGCGIWEGVTHLKSRGLGQRPWKHSVCMHSNIRKMVCFPILFFVTLRMGKGVGICLPYSSWLWSLIGLSLSLERDVNCCEIAGLCLYYHYIISSI